MSFDPVIFIGTYRIPEGSLDEWRTGSAEMTVFVDANEPRVIGIGHYANEDGTEGTSIHVHPDSESLEHHLQAASAQIGKGSQIVQVVRIELYGPVSVAVVERLRSMSTGWPIVVKGSVGGFSRVAPA